MLTRRNPVVTNLFAGVVLAAFAFSAATAGAVGMGRLNVLSSIGQRLHVEIELISVDRDERGTLSAKLGSARAYERSNLHLGTAAESGVRVSVEQRANGEPYLRATSAKPVNEPFVNLLIELTSSSGSITREFSVLLDPPEITPAKSVEAEPRPPLAAAETKPPAPVRAADSDAVSAYGPLKRGETLSRIAAKVRPQNATLQQTMLGIFRHNPAAFINNNMNLLKAGHRLRIPDAGQIAALSQADSVQALRTQTTAWAAHRTATAAEARAPQPQAPPAGKAAAPATAGDRGKHVVKLSSGATAGKAPSTEDKVRMLEEDLAARERALNDANERIKRLERAAAGAAEQKK